MSFSELAFLFLLGLILFGPKKLPELARQLGRIMGELRRASQEFQSQLSDEVRQLDQENNISNTISNFQVTGTTARERIINAVLDAGSTIKASLDDKPALPAKTEQTAPEAATQTQTPSETSSLAAPSTISAEETPKETIH